MTRKSAALFILAIIVLSMIPTPSKKWMVSADGASDPEEIWIEWRHTVNEGYTGTAGNGVGTDGRTQVSEFNITYQYAEINITDLGVYYYRGYIWSDDADTRDWNWAAYNYTAENDAGVLIDYSTSEISEAPGDSTYSWRTYSFDQVMINESMGLKGDDWVFYFGMSDDGDNGQMFLSEGDGGDTTGQKHWDDDPDLPLNFGEDGTDAFLPPAQIRFWGYQNTTTNYNQFVGNATHQIDRHDINYTFPANVDNERIRTTVDIDKDIVNVTRYNGGAWDTVLAQEDFTIETYNSTHKILTIPEATINSYGGRYRIYESTFDYLYLIGGAFWENGTSYGAVNITAAYEGGSNTIEVNGSTTIGQDTEIILFQWDVGDAVRFYYTRETQEQFNIYFPEDTYATYEFKIRDLTGELQTQDGDSHLESLRYINNSLDVIERVAIADVVNDVPLTLVTYHVYRLRILHPDDHVINFGIQVTGVITNPTLVIDDIEFSAQAQITYRYLTVEVTRPTATQITVNYNDSLADTDSIAFYLTYRNGTAVFNETVNEDNYQFNFLGADAWTDYQMTVVITHGTFGTRTHREIIGVERTFNPFPDVSMVGSIGPISTGNILSLFIVIIVALAFSAVNAEVAGFTAVAVAYILRYWGANDFSYGMLSICMALVIGYAIVRRAT